MTVHPHGRGDNVDQHSDVALDAGSPPRAWGQCAVAGAGSGIERFTPTGVGTIHRRTSRGPRSSVHPHGRGDNATTHRLRKTTSGSPPRAWGQSRGELVELPARRFTPTGVGTMRKRPAPNGSSAVHPHGRGDNPTEAIRRVRIGGSPPQAWGQCRVRAENPLLKRFTPTGVGTINTHLPDRATHAVHPHGRGDNPQAHVAGPPQFGSPPRAWGQ